MDYDQNITVSEYTTWLVTTMATLDDGPDFDHLQDAFNRLMDDITFLENCYRLDPYEAN